MAKKRAYRPELPVERPQGPAPVPPPVPQIEENPVIEDCGLPNKALFRIDEVAAHFDVSERCVRLWIEHKLLTAEQYREKGAIRVTRESILNFRLKSRQEA